MKGGQHRHTLWELCNLGGCGVKYSLYRLYMIQYNLFVVSTARVHLPMLGSVLVNPVSPVTRSPSVVVWAHTSENYATQRCLPLAHNTRYVFCQT